MPKHKKLKSIPYPSGGRVYQFCLDSVDRTEEGEEMKFAFVWRGNKRSPEGFVLRPAYFSFGELGKLLRIFFSEQENNNEKSEFMQSLLNDN